MHFRSVIDTSRSGTRRKPDKGNGVVILNRRLYNKAVEEIISDICKFEKLNEGPTLKHESELQRFLRKLKKTFFLMKWNMISCIHLVLLLLVSMVFLKCTDSPLVIYFLNFVPLFRLYVLLIITLLVSLVIFFHLWFLMITLNIFKHLHSSEICFDSYKSICFRIIDQANSKFDLKIKEVLQINWRKSNLNAQENYLAPTLSL